MSLNSFCWISFVFIDGDLQGFKTCYLIHGQILPNTNPHSLHLGIYTKTFDHLGSLMTPPLTADEVHLLGMFNLEVVSYLLRCLQSVSEQSNTTFLADWGVSRQRELRHKLLQRTGKKAHLYDLYIS